MALHYTTLHPAVVVEATATTPYHSKKTRREPTFGPSLTLPPPPCAVLLEYCIPDTTSVLKPPNRFLSPS
jgi:hypothetical protein